MDIYDYTTSGGKNLITEYIDSLPNQEKAQLYAARKLINEEGLLAFSVLTTRHLYGKLYEIKIAQNRIMYVIADKDSVYFLHICKKQKGKAERQELQKGIQRAKEEGLL